MSGEGQRFFITRQLQNARLEAVLLEPVGRNTSSAAALAAAWLHSSGRDELMLLVPSDHVIGDRQAFFDAIALAIPHADQGAIVTFGAQPTEPNTQYGYIEAKADQKFVGAFPIARFHEKPDSQSAAHYLASRRFFWNCGIFLAKASTLLSEMRQFLPDSLDAIERAVRDARSDGPFVRPSAEAFAQADNISIDNGIMEKTSRGVVVPVQMDWSDVGAWDAVWKLSSKNADQNATKGNVVAVDTHNSLLRNEGRTLLATLGVKDMAVIAVSDAIFVAPISRAGEVKELIAKLQQQEPDRTSLPPKIEQPWGSSEAIATGSGLTIKHIVVEPRETLSAPTVDHRSKHWVIVQGSAKLTTGDEVSMLHQNDSRYIPAGTGHALANAGEIPLHLVEIEFASPAAQDDPLSL